MTSDQQMPWWFNDFIMRERAPRPQGVSGGVASQWDVIVVGSGLAGLVAAIFAHEAGRSVVILEAADEGGGTTWKSGGGLWVPNNHVMRALGIPDDRDKVLQLIGKLGYPNEFDADADHYGLTDWQWGQITAFYDNAPAALEELCRLGALAVRAFPSFTERFPAMVPYHVDIDDSLQGYYRHVVATTEDGGCGAGPELVRQLWAAADDRGIELRTRNRVTGLVLDDSGAVGGVVVHAPDGETALSAHRGVIFATGGFAHDEELLAEYSRAPLYSSCAVPTARGDFLRIARDAGADLAQTGNAWFHQDVLEKAAANGRECMEGGINVPTGESMVIVDYRGERVVNEKALYHERGQIHVDPGPDGSFPNRVLFMVYDDFVATDATVWLCLDTFVVPKPWIIQAETLPELAKQIEGRLAGLEGLIGSLQLTSDFAERVQASIDRFNRFARAGSDEDFGRGRLASEHEWGGPPRPENHRNPTMYPFADSGPYYCVMLCAHLLDTNGGPRIDPAGRVLRPDGTVVDGLYGAGNCVPSIAGEAYVSGGGTLGPALAAAYAAARHVVQREPSMQPAAAER